MNNKDKIYKQFKTNVVLVGSERKSIPNSSPLSGKASRPDPKEVIEVTISVRRKRKMPAWIIQTGVITREQLAADHGASNSDLTAVAHFAKKYKLRVIEKNPAALTLKVTGTISNMEKAFGTRLRNVNVGNKVYRERKGAITLPEDVAPIIEGVFGLDNRQQADVQFRLASRIGNVFTPSQVAALYKFPGGTGAGQTIAIIELNGGYSTLDLNTFFTHQGLRPPAVTSVSVSGGENLPTGNPQGPDAEVMLDIGIAGSIAPDAQIKVYFAPNTDKGFLDAVNAAIHDTNIPTVISISWGGPECAWTDQAFKAFEKAFQNAAALSIPVVVASGDKGSTGGTNDLSVDFPASAPHVLACGGTHLEGDGKTITNEVVWNSNGASGGGVSKAFPKPFYQSKIDLPLPGSANAGRGVPDVCGVADPETGYMVNVDGVNQVLGGTSAVAPLWAGLIARLAEFLGHRVPFLNPILYAHPGALNDITIGNNDIGNGGGKYQARTGWDACTGLGSPKGKAILNILKGTPKVTATHSLLNERHRVAKVQAKASTIPGGTALGKSGNKSNKRNSENWDQLPPAVEPNPVLPFHTDSQTMLPVQMDSDNHISAVSAILSNTATSAIAAITAIASHNNK